MNMHDAFLADITTNREDDTPRLIYADWLQENGDPDRAAFIRAQCRLAQTRSFDLDHESLAADEAELFRKNEKKWLKNVPKLRATIRFERGFPHRFWLPLPTLLEKGASLFAAAPTLSVYQPAKHDEGWEQFIDSSYLTRLSGLILGDYSIRGKRLATLLASPVCVGLCTLKIVGNNLGNVGTQALTTTPNLVGLRHLKFLGDPNSGPMLAAMASSPCYPNLTSLDLERHCIAPIHFAALAQSPLARQLESFALDWIGGGDDYALAFAEGDWRSLRRLTLTLNSMTASGIAAIASCPTLSGLEELSLTFRRGESVASLFKSPYLVQLKRLALNSGPAAGSVKPLATSPMLVNLRGLVIDEVKDAIAEDLIPIMDNPVSAGLVELHLAESRNLADVATAYARAGHLVNLRRLSLRGLFGSGAAWARTFFLAPHLAHVVSLNLSATNIGKDAYPMMLESPYLGNIRRLWLAKHSYSDDPALSQRVVERFGTALQDSGW